MGDAGFTHGQVKRDYSIDCKRCNDAGVLIDPKTGKRSVYCPTCLLWALDQLFIHSGLRPVFEDVYK